MSRCKFWDFCQRCVEGITLKVNAGLETIIQTTTLHLALVSDKTTRREGQAEEKLIEELKRKTAWGKMEKVRALFSATQTFLSHWETSTTIEFFSRSEL